MFKIFYKFLYFSYRLYSRIWNPKVDGVYILIRFNQDILAIKNSYRDYWTIPCGMVGRREAYPVAAAREVFEEVGINISPEKLKFVRLIFDDTDYKRDHIYLYFYEASSRPIVQIDNKEVEDFQWIPIQKIEQEYLFNPIKKAIKELLS